MNEKLFYCKTIKKGNFCHHFPATAQASHDVREEISPASTGRKKKRHVRVSYCEERKEWQWERASVIWSSVICLLDPCTQNMLRLKEMERGRERQDPSNPSGILMLLFRPHGDFRDRRWAWKGITAKPFHWFQKICSKLLWEQISTWTDGLSLSPLSEFTTSSANKAKSGMG